MPRHSTSLWSILITFADLMEVANADFRRLPDVCGNVKLPCFSDGFVSPQSRRQLFCLSQSFGCPSDPIMAIDIAARLFHIALAMLAT
jgi:hypothetical protein